MRHTTIRHRYAILLIVFVLLATIAVIIIAMLPSGARTERLVEQWREAGGTETAADLRPEPIPDDRNAAVLYERAFEHFGRLSPEARSAIGEQTLSPEVRAALDELREALDLAVQAGTRPECVWDSPIYDQGFDALSPHLSDARTLAQSLGLAAHVAAEGGDTARAVELLTAGRRLGNHVIAEPTLRDMLTGVATHLLMLEHFRSIFAERPLPQTNIEAFLDSGFAHDAVQRVVIGEGSIGLEAIRDQHREGLARLFSDHDEQFYLETMLRLLNQVQRPHADRDLRFLEDDAPMTAIVSRMILPVWSRSLQHPARVKRHELVARAAVELRHHRDEHGTYPESWEIPDDPVYDRPFIYERTDEGFTIRSDMPDDNHPLEWSWR